MTINDLINKNYVQSQSTNITISNMYLELINIIDIFTKEYNEYNPTKIQFLMSEDVALNFSLWVIARTESNVADIPMRFANIDINIINKNIIEDKNILIICKK